ncbi:MAG: nucleoside-diphosphate sugar epimerase/dehydratase [Armatimonadota bacterium]
MKRIAQLGQLWQARFVPYGRFLWVALTDMLIIILALVLAVGLASNFRYQPVDRPFLLGVSPLLIIVGLALLWAKGLYRVHSRYAGLSDIFNLVAVGATLTITSFLLTLGWSRWTPREFRFAEPVLFGGLVLGLLTFSRVGRRLYEWYRASTGQTQPQRTTLIVGGGDAGEMLMRETRRNPNSGYRVIGFVDDDPHKRHTRIHGYPCLGTTEEIPRIAEEHRVQEIVIAIPSAPGEVIRRLFELCRQTNARVRILPFIPTVHEDGIPLAQLREVRLEDLLRRQPIVLKMKAVSDYVAGERVLITGAGGSIGSELARQIVQVGPANLILLGKGENSIYQVEQEIITDFGYEPRCVIADVRDATRISAIMRQEQPTLIFHAAAHKHVPLMESNPIEAIKNNVLGTWVMAEEAVRHNIRKFVYISTDKAVKPASIMGATKRVGEMIVSALAQQSETQFAIVRFGNVLGSRGSVIPTLQMHIEKGGPVRLTHPDMRRYFMSITEAVHLVLLAGALPSRGDIFILDMGEPIRIVDMARDLIRLYGLVPDKDIKIVFTGVRPGEKLYEELCYSEEDLEPTVHEKIRRVRNGNAPDWEWLRGQLELLMELCDKERVDEARAFLMELATGRRIPTLTKHGVVQA